MYIERAINIYTVLVLERQRAGRAAHAHHQPKDKKGYVFIHGSYTKGTHRESYPYIYSIRG